MIICKCFWEWYLTYVNSIIISPGINYNFTFGPFVTEFWILIWYETSYMEGIILFAPDLGYFI